MGLKLRRSQDRALLGRPTTAPSFARSRARCPETCPELSNSDLRQLHSDDLSCPCLRQKPCKWGTTEPKVGSSNLSGRAKRIASNHGGFDGKGRRAQGIRSTNRVPNCGAAAVSSLCLCGRPVRLGAFVPTVPKRPEASWDVRASVPERGSDVPGRARWCCACKRAYPRHTVPAVAGRPARSPRFPWACAAPRRRGPELLRLTPAFREQPWRELTAGRERVVNTMDRRAAWGRRADRATGVSVDDEGVPGLARGQPAAAGRGVPRHRARHRGSLAHVGASACRLDGRVAQPRSLLGPGRRPGRRSQCHELERQRKDWSASASTGAPA